MPEEAAPIPITPIKGYRQLSQNEVDLMNEGMDLEVKLNAWLARLKAMPKGEPSAEQPVTDTIDPRWLATGTTYCEIGLMCLRRSIAKPKPV